MEETQLGGAVRSRLLRDGYPITRQSWADLPGMGRPIFIQSDAIYQTCGALPILCELPAGTTVLPFSLDEMLDIGLIVIEETLNYANTDGLRPYEFWTKVKVNSNNFKTEAALLSSTSF